MKIYLVTMKQLGDYWVGERLRFMKMEASMGGEPHESRPSHLDRDKDAAAVSIWRENLKARIDLLTRIGISIQPDRSPGGDEDDEYVMHRHLYAPTFPCTGDQLLQIMEVDDSITVKSAAPIASDSPEGLLARFDAVVKKLEAIDIPDPMEPPQHIYNQHCEVHIPGPLLATYNETLLLEDSCTDALQDALNNGWRMVAVCPQSQRRPDYILGRYNPDIETNGKGAERKP
jgi:hypothetical protein